jgi:serine protease AprX
MKRLLLLVPVLLAAAACDIRPGPAAPPGDLAVTSAGTGLIDPLLAAALAAAAPTDQLVVIANYDEAATTGDALSGAILSLGAGVLRFKHLGLVAALATPARITAIAGLPGLRGLYANRQLHYESLLLHESVPTIRADAVQAAGITGRGVGIAILDSGIDGLSNSDVAYPSKTVQNVKIAFGLADAFSGSPPLTGADLFVENLPVSETSVGHGTHVAGIAAGNGSASGGYYRGVAPGAKLVGIGAGDVLFVIWILAGFDYILDHQAQYGIKVVNNSWGTTGAFDPNDPVNKATRAAHDAGITVVFAAGNDGPNANTLNPYSVAPWVIGVAAGCKLVTDPTNSAALCDDPTGQNRPPYLADFSSRGVPNDTLYHPDITAPGVRIVSDRASTGTVLTGLDGPDDLLTCKIGLLNLIHYTCASGTSMATPHIAGVVALMQEAAGGSLTPDQVLDVITRTARPLPGFGAWETGAGYVDAYAAVSAVKAGVR